MQANRLPPALPAGAYKTYQLFAPQGTHFRSATCAEADCPAFLHGWRTMVDESGTLGASQAAFIRGSAGRRFTEDRDDSGFTVFTFEAGQRCFSSHQVRLDRPPLYIVRGGDWRGDPRGTQPRYHSRPEFWVEDFAEHQQGLSDQLEKG